MSTQELLVTNLISLSVAKGTHFLKRMYEKSLHATGGSMNHQISQRFIEFPNSLLLPFRDPTRVKGTGTRMHSIELMIGKC